MSRYIEIPDDGIIRKQIFEGGAVVGARCIDLSNYPTIDAEPVKRGKWEDKREISVDSLLKYGDDIIEERCSHCHRYSMRIARYIEPEYCSHCGAKMGVTSDEYA